MNEKDKLLNYDSQFDKEEQEYAPGEEAVISKPYDPNLVDVISQPLTVQLLLSRIEHREIDLTPAFQRKSGLWNPTQKSRLIESILIKIPLPVFYFDARDDDMWTIVDGLQRTSTLDEFVINEKWKLCNLEYLKELEGCSYSDLSRSMQRRIQECQLLTYCIRKGTPDDVTTSIFQRLNTGGLTLTKAEIRNCVYKGIAADLVKDMAELSSFAKATRGTISPDRMDDRDLATRFLAFYLQGNEKYDGNMDAFMEKGLQIVKEENSPERANIVLNAFDKSMEYSYALLGEKAFRKRTKSKNRTYGRINKSLFECTACCMGRLTEKEMKKLVSRKDLFFEKYEKLFDGKFYDAVNSATGSIEHVNVRYEELGNLISEVIGGTE